MATINLAKTVETIRWSDEPDAREYEIDFSDANMGTMRDALTEIKGTLEKVSTEEDAPVLANAIRDFVIAVAGKDCYEDALTYVDPHGLGAEQCTGMMTSLVVGLADIVSQHLEFAQSAKANHYLRTDRDAADLI